MLRSKQSFSTSGSGKNKRTARTSTQEMLLNLPAKDVLPWTACCKQESVAAAAPPLAKLLFFVFASALVLGSWSTSSGTSAGVVLLGVAMGLTLGAKKSTSTHTMKINYGQKSTTTSKMILRAQQQQQESTSESEILEHRKIDEVLLPSAEDESTVLQMRLRLKMEVIKKQTTEQQQAKWALVWTEEEDNAEDNANASSAEPTGNKPLQLALDCPGTSVDEFLGCFVFWNKPADPSNGHVRYAKGMEKKEELITHLPEKNQISLNFQTGQLPNELWGKRPAIRMHTKYGFTHGAIFVVDVERMRAIDGSWPAYWTAHKGGIAYVPNGYRPEDGLGHAHWPESGEFDLMEHLHGWGNQEMITTLHTEYGNYMCGAVAPQPCNGNCNVFRTMTNVLNAEPSQEAVENYGEINLNLSDDGLYETCEADYANNIHAFEQAECSAQLPDLSLYLKERNCEGSLGCGVKVKGVPNGVKFNEQRGGIHIMQLEEDETRFYWIPRAEVEAAGSTFADAETKKPEFWERKLAESTPYAVFPTDKDGNCPSARLFRTQTLIINNTFCGDWAGKDFKPNGNAHDQGHDACNSLVASPGYGVRGADSIYPDWVGNTVKLLPDETFGTNFVFNSVKVFSRGGKGVGYFDWDEDRMLNGDEVVEEA